MAAPWDANPGWSAGSTAAELSDLVVFGTPGDGKVPAWNATAGRLEWATPSGGGGGASEPLGWIAIRYGDMITLTGGGGTMMATVPFDAPDDIGGTGISWDAGAPDQIALEAGHWYGASLTIFHVEQPSDYATAEFETAIQLWPADDLVETYGNFNPVDLRNHSHGDPAVNVEWPMFRVDQDGSFLRVHLKTRGITGTPQAYSPEFTVWRVS